MRKQIKIILNLSLIIILLVGIFGFQYYKKNKLERETNLRIEGANFVVQQIIQSISEKGYIQISDDLILIKYQQEQNNEM